jgi:hypothetical protein
MIDKLRIAITAVVVLAAVGAGPVGAANGKDRVRETFGGPYASSVGCGAFDVLVEGTERVGVTDVFDGDGTLVRTDVHVSFDEVNTNSVTGEVMLLKGTVHVRFDWAANTRTLTGVVFMGKTAEGKAFQDTGRIVITLDTSEALFVAGPHDVFFGGGIDAMGCKALG